MLEIIISILLSFGINAENLNGKINVNSQVIDQLKSLPEYNSLGGDSVLNSIAIPDDVDPNN